MSLLLLAWLVLLPGCSRILVASGPLPDAPIYPPTASVQVLRDFPDEPFELIGAIFIQPNFNNPPEDKIERTLRRQGALLGADAVVITFDRFTIAGAPAPGDIEAGIVQPDYGQSVRATAIRYLGHRNTSVTR